MNETKTTLPSPERTKSTMTVATRMPAEPTTVKVAYIMSRFPKLTETFILYEILALEELGLRIELYPLLRERQSVSHPEVDKLLPRARFQPFFSLPILKAQWHFLWRKPVEYSRTLFTVLRGAWGSTNFFFGALGIFPKAVRFAYEMQEQGINLVHAHFANHPAVAALIIHRLTGIPYSFTAHGSDLHVERRMLDKKVEAAAFAVTISSYNKELMIRECGEDVRGKIHVIHSGVDPNVFRPAPRQAKNGRPHILCVGSYEEVKGHTYLVEACRILRDRGVDFVCDLVGEGPLRGKVEAQIERAGLQNVALVHGGRPRPEVAQMMADADIMVLPSVPTRRGKREGIPVVLMEAMASGLPVVSSAISGIPELVENGRTGLLTPPGDAADLADALQQLLQDPELRTRMGRLGREKVIREFNLYRSAERLAKLFRATARRKDSTTMQGQETGIGGKI